MEIYPKTKANIVLIIVYFGRSNQQNIDKGKKMMGYQNGAHSFGKS